jgi:hypothetical protein
MYKKIFLFLIMAFAVFSIGTANVKAWEDCSDDRCEINYFFTTYKMNGTTFSVAGYAVGHKQVYQQYNHSYYLVLRGNLSHREYRTNLTTTNHTLNLLIGGYLNACPDDAPAPTCSKYNNWTGFQGDINIADIINNGDTRDTSYEVWLGINEYGTNGSREYRTRVKTYESAVGTSTSSEYKNMIISINKTALTNRIYNGTTGVMARKDRNSRSAWQTSEVGLNANNVNGRKTMYIGVGEYAGTGWGYDSDGTVWYSFRGNPTYNVDWTYGGNNTFVPGSQYEMWESTAYSHLIGNPTYITITKNKYAEITNLVSYTSKSGTKTNVVGTYVNNKSGSPIRYSLCVYPDNNKNGTPDCTSGTSTNTGTVTITKEVTSSNKNRYITFDIEETYTGFNRSNSGERYGVDSTLYTASNENIAKNTATGTITPKNPIKVIKRPNTNQEKYFEVITFDNPQNYVITEGDFNGGSIRRRTGLSYNAGGAGYGNIKFSGLGGTNTVQNYISNPASTTEATLTEQSDLSFKTDNVIYIPYRNLNEQSLKTTYKNVGVNNVTIVLNSTYRFDKGSNIENIDTYTMEETDKSRVTTTIKNNTNRKIRWQISYNGTKVKDGETTWDGEKTFDINEFTVPYNGIIETKIIEPNGVVSTLKGNVYVSSKEEITLTEGETYTPTNPVRVFTTQNNVQKYFETISVNSINTDLNINAGEGFENKIKINYTTTSNNIPLNNDEITVVTTFPEQEFDLNFSEDVEGVHVPLDTTYTSETEHVCELPEVVVERKEGAIYKKGDSKIGEQEILDGGRRWYTKMTAEDGKYDFYNDIKHVGANAINIKYYNQYNIKDKLIGNTQATFKVIRVQNPSNPDYKYHKTYTLSELLETFKKDGE